MSRHCPWCASPVTGAPTKCAVCGGDLAPAPDTAGPPPPPAPRGIPAEFRRRTMLSKNVLVIVGIVFGAIGFLFSGIFGLVALAAGEWPMLAGAAFGSLFALIGAFLFRSGWRKGRAILRALEHGVAVVGNVTEVDIDRSVSINHRHPWKIRYAYEARGARHGEIQCWDDPPVQAGQPVHILYSPDDPDESTIYPPIR